MYLTDQSCFSTFSPSSLFSVSSADSFLPVYFMVRALTPSMHMIIPVTMPPKCLLSYSLYSSRMKRPMQVHVRRTNV